MAVSQAFGNQVSRFSLAVAGAKSHAADLPKEAGKLATSLESTVTDLATLNAEHEKARVVVATTGKKIQAGLKAGRAARAKIVSFAEGSFGKRDERVKQFRAVHEGQVTRRKPRSDKSNKKDAAPK